MLKKSFIIMCLILIIFSFNVFAVDTYEGYNLPIDIEINGDFIKCSEKPILIGGTTYIPIRAFSDAVGGVIQWDSVQRASTMVKDGHSFIFYPERNYCIIDGVQKDYPSVFYNNLTFIPIRAVSQTLGYTVSWDSFYLTVKISAPGVVVPETCKDKSYSYEDVLYLGKITQIESGSQPFKVKLGICGTIMNRVKSKQFPNSVKGVIMDTKYGVQFPPAHTSKMNVVPSTESIIAAKCSLAGVNLVGKSLYFIDVKSAPKSWAHKNRPFYGTIGGMSFYE